jgi:hypothetical protein
MVPATQRSLMPAAAAAAAQSHWMLAISVLMLHIAINLPSSA